MMKKLLLFVFACMLSIGASAQARWKGTKVEDLTNGTPVFLYNVGTGRMLIHGGDWGTQARLFYEASGKLLTFKINSGRYVFDTGMSTYNNSTEGVASTLGANIPGVTSRSGWSDGDEVYTILMDANENYRGNNNISGTRNWVFTQVPEEEEGVYTYYMHEVLNGTSYWMGAAYGENHQNFDGDPNGELVLLSSSFDKATWTTANPEGNTNYTCELKTSETGYPGTVERNMGTLVPIFNVDTQIPLRDLYKWRIVTLAQLEAAAQGHDVSDGMTADLTALIYDRGLERNDWSFFTYWNTGTFSDYDYASITGTEREGRYGYTWGMNTGTYNTQTNNQDSPQKHADQPWDMPVRLKAQWNSKVDAKFGFLEFEGVGTASTSVTAPFSGSYVIGAYGYYEGPNPGYLFVSTKDPQASDFTQNDIVNMVAFPQESDFYKSTSAFVKAAGSNFVYNKNPYYVQIEIDNVTANQPLYFGVAKFAATKCNTIYNYGTINTCVMYATHVVDGVLTKYYLTSDLDFSTDESKAQRWYMTDDGNPSLYLLEDGVKQYLVCENPTNNNGILRGYLGLSTTQNTNCYINPDNGFLNYWATQNWWLTAVIDQPIEKDNGEIRYTALFCDHDSYLDEGDEVWYAMAKDKEETTTPSSGTTITGDTYNGSTVTTYSTPMSIRNSSNGNNYLGLNNGSLGIVNSSTKIWYVDEDNYLYYLDGETKTYLTYTGNRQSYSTGFIFTTTYYYYSLGTTTTRSTACVKYTGSSLSSSSISAGSNLVVTISNDTYYLRYRSNAFSLINASAQGDAVYLNLTATQTTTGNYTTNYYYDSDWVCSDQFRLLYLGEVNAIYLDEEYTSANDYVTLYGNNLYENRNIRLKRAFQKNAWNSFVFPYNMTPVQIRNAFGDEARVAALDGLGTQSGKPQCIDFKSVPLPAESAQPAIEAGKFYMVKPVKDPETTTLSNGETVTYYSMGTFDFQAGTMPAIESKTVESIDESVTGVTSYATYVKSSLWENGQEGSAYSANGGNGIYVPAGGYVVGSKSNSTETYMSRLTKNMRIKGFRGWLVDNASSGVKLTNMSLNGDELGETTGIEDIIVSEPVNVVEGVYDLAGRRIANDAQTLNKGVYIINGKKYIVR